MSFDPDATGVIPRITVERPPSTEAAEPGVRDDEDTAPRPRGSKAVDGDAAGAPETDAGEASGGDADELSGTGVDVVSGADEPSVTAVGVVSGADAGETGAGETDPDETHADGLDVQTDGDSPDTSGSDRADGVESDTAEPDAGETEPTAPTDGERDTRETDADLPHTAAFDATDGDTSGTATPDAETPDTATPDGDTTDPGASDAGETEARTDADLSDARETGAGADASDAGERDTDADADASDASVTDEGASETHRDDPNDDADARGEGASADTSGAREGEAGAGGSDDVDDRTRPGVLPKAAPSLPEGEEVELSATVTRRLPASFAVQIGHPPTKEDAASLEGSGEGDAAPAVQEPTPGQKATDGQGSPATSGPDAASGPDVRQDATVEPGQTASQGSTATSGQTAGQAATAASRAGAGRGSGAAQADAQSAQEARPAPGGQGSVRGPAGQSGIGAFAGRDGVGAPTGTAGQSGVDGLTALAGQGASSGSAGQGGVGGSTALAGPGGAGSSAGLAGGSAVLAGQAPQGGLGTLPAKRDTPAGKAARAAGLKGLLQSSPKWLPVLLTLEGLVMYILALRIAPGPLRGVDPTDIDGLGLISAMPLSAFAAILIMIAAFFVTVTQSSDRKFLLLFQIAVITFALHGAGAIVADEPRFPTAWVHAGFVDYISRSGETSIQMDARMGWPGFFALFSFVTKTAGITDLRPILAWTPLLSNLLYLLPFVLILRQVVATTRARWFAALLFVLVQWIGQDYFSPQGFTFALYLAFVAILLRWFGRVEQRTKPLPGKGKIKRLFAKLDAMLPGELANTGMFRADKLLMLMLLIALFVAATASHQITPFMMLGVLTAFLLFRRTSLTWALPFFFGLMVLAWISYQTVGFWSTNLDTIFGGLGRLLDNLQRGTQDRISGSDPTHALVLKARLGICAAVLLLAATGFFRRLRRGVFDRAALILLGVPALAMGLQSYGGEMPLRVYMFALPGACLLAAYAFFPNLPSDSGDVQDETVPVRKRNPRFNPELTRKISLGLAASVAVVFAMSFLVARYGNEKFERVTPSEVAAMRYLYAHDKPSARVLYIVPKSGPESTPIMPWGERDYERFNYLQTVVDKDPKNTATVVAKLKAEPRNTFLVVTTAQAAYLELNEGFPKTWLKDFRTALDASKDLRRVFTGEDAAIYTLKSFVKGTEIPEPTAPTGIGDPSTPWDVIGLIALAIFWPALFAYEVIRLHGPNRAPRARRRLLFIAIPAFALSLGVIIERFIYIALNG